jgi:hypothetical protein
MVIYGYFRILRILPSFRRTQTSSKEQTNLRFGRPRPTGPPAQRVVPAFPMPQGRHFMGIVNLWRPPINISQVKYCSQLLDIRGVDVIYVLNTAYNHITLRLRHHHISGTVVISLTVTFGTCAGEPARQTEA